MKPIVVINKIINIPARKTFHVVTLLLFLKIMLQCKRVEVTPIDLNISEREKDAVNCPLAMVVLSNNQPVLSYKFEYGQDNNLLSIVEVFYKESSSTGDTANCVFLYNEQKYLSHIQWKGKMAFGVMGFNHPSKIDYEFVYDSDLQLKQVTASQKSIFDQTQSVIAIPSPSAFHKYFLVNEYLGMHSDTLKEIYHASRSPTIEVFTNQHYRFSYEKGDSIITVKFQDDINFKIISSTLQNKFPFVIWPIISSFVERSMFENMHNFSALRPEVYYYFSSYIKDRYSHYPFSCKNSDFTYTYSIDNRLESIVASYYGNITELKISY